MTLEDKSDSSKMNQGEISQKNLMDEGILPTSHTRTKLVNTATEFLVSPNVQNSSMDLKVSFLKRKGLTDEEINLAIKQAEDKILTMENSRKSVELGHFNSPPPTMVQVGYFQRARDITNTIILLSGVAYGIYWAYGNFIKPFFFGEKDKKSINSQLEELEQLVTESITKVCTSIDKVKEHLDVSERRTEAVNKQMEELKTEVASLKKLLLNRKQFPSATIGAPLTIPSWQIPSSEDKDTAEEEGEGNGSGTNGSDSSLEMIKE